MHGFHSAFREPEQAKSLLLPVSNEQLVGWPLTITRINGTNSYSPPEALEHARGILAEAPRFKQVDRRALRCAPSAITSGSGSSHFE
jgi:hypothetical protein